MAWVDRKTYMDRLRALEGKGYQGGHGDASLR
mgnify:CR=1 FL=1